MVSSASVQNDLNSFGVSLDNYHSNFEAISSSWKGPSYENLSAKVEEFIGEYKSTIQNQMNAFVAAVSAYQEYLNNKNQLHSVESAYNSAVASNNSSAVSSYSSQISQYNTRLAQLKQEIENNLAQASSPKLTATAIGAENAASVVNLSAVSGAAAETAISTALQIAEDNSHGYSQQRRWGNPDYDCSSFVITCWDSAGTGVKDAGATYTGNMRKAFLSTGLFEWIPGNPSVENLKPGDIVLNENKHTEMYIGDGKLVGAHGDRDGRGGDGGGTEISVTNYHSTWQGVLRYIGDQNTAVSI